MNGTPISQIMSHPAVTIHSDERLEKALYLFQKNQISILPVINTQGWCVGVITLKDLINKQSEMIDKCCGRKPGDRHPIKDSETIAYFGDLLVHEGMSPHFHAVSENSSIEECIDLLIDQKIHHLPVLNHENRLVGIVSPLDLMLHMRSHLVPN